MSDNLELVQVATNQNNKETTINDQAAQLDAALTDLATIDLTGASSPLALSDANSIRRMVLKLTGTNPGAPFEVHVPANRKLYVVWNTSGDEVTVTIAGGSGVTVGHGDLRLIYADGIDVQLIAGGAVASGGSGLAIRQAVRAVATSGGTLASDFENGDTIDGVTLATADRILLAGQTTASENGIYVVQATGTPVRASDFDEDGDLQRGVLIPVLEGDTYSGTVWMLTTAGPYTLGTTELAFERISGKEATPVGVRQLLDDTSTADGVATDFTLDDEPEGSLLVFIDGVLQDEDDYSIVGTTLTFATAPPAGSHVIAYDGGFTGATRPFVAGMFIPGTQPDGALLAELVFPFAVDFPDDFAGSELYARTAAAAQTVLDVQKNGANVGTITVAASAQTCTFATSGSGTLGFAVGDRLAVLNESPADATLSDISISFHGTRQ